MFIKEAGDLTQFEIKRIKKPDEKAGLNSVYAFYRNNDISISVFIQWQKDQGL
jgi:hypothetical protein